MKKTKILSSALLIIAIILCIYVFSRKNEINKNKVSEVSTSTNVAEISAYEQIPNANRIFVFDNFHGSVNIHPKFEFEYPANWVNDGQNFSPQKIEYYDMFSPKAPFYFDLIRSDVFDQTEFKYQIDHSKRKSPDTHGTINYKEFKRYDLIDYGSYGGDSAGEVIIYVGPAINIDGLNYILVFHWEEKPLASFMQGNDLKVFENSVKSLKFTE